VCKLHFIFIYIRHHDLNFFFSHMHPVDCSGVQRKVIRRKARDRNVALGDSDYKCSNLVLHYSFFFCLLIVVRLSASVGLGHTVWVRCGVERGKTNATLQIISVAKPDEMKHFSSIGYVIMNAMKQHQNMFVHLTSPRKRMLFFLRFSTLIFCSEIHEYYNKIHNTTMKNSRKTRKQQCNNTNRKRVVRKEKGVENVKRMEKIMVALKFSEIGGIDSRDEGAEEKNMYPPVSLVSLLCLFELQLEIIQFGAI
jgi:hypothetical protein